MEIKRKRTFLLISTVIILLIFTIFMGRNLVALSKTGWVGMTYFPPLTADKQIAPPKMPFSLGFGKLYRLRAESPAEKAGLQRDDEVVEINGIPTRETSRIEQASSEAKIGDTATYRIKRVGKEQYIQVRLDTPL